EHDRDEVEDAVREHRPDERRPGTSPPRQLPRQHRHARQLADPAGQYSVREQPDRERGEDEREPRPRRRHRLPDHGLPRERADEHGEQVEPDRASDPLPADDRERVSDRLPARPAPDEERDHRSATRQPVMSEATTGVADANARVSTIPKLSPPSDGATSALAAVSSSVNASCSRKPRTSMPSSETRSRVSSSRTASGSAPTTCRRAPV